MESTLLIKNEGLIKDIKDCVINVVSEIEEALSKQLVFDELSFEVNIQHCFDVPKWRRMFCVMNNLLWLRHGNMKISHDLPMVTLS